MTARAHQLVHRIVDAVYLGSMERFPAIAPYLSSAVSAALYSTASRMNHVLAGNARLALGPAATDEQVRTTVRRMLQCMQDSIRITLLSANQSVESLVSRVSSFRGQEHYHDARAVSRGILMTSVHMGFFEPCLALLRRYERRIHVLYQSDPMPRFERARSLLRQKLDIVEHRLESGLDAWVSLRDALNRGEVVIMHSDRAMRQQDGARMRFLGADDALLPTGPVRLALACGAAIIPTYCTSTPDGLHVEMDSPIQCPQHVLRAREVVEHPSQLALIRSMEHAIRAAPDQWLAFWRVREAVA